MGKFPGLELSLCKGPVAGASVGITKEPLKGEGLSGAGNGVAGWGPSVTVAENHPSTPAALRQQPT